MRLVTIKSRFGGSRCSVCKRRHISKGDVIVKYNDGWALLSCYEEGVANGTIIDQDVIRKRIKRVLLLKKAVFELTNKRIGIEIDWSEGLTKLLDAGILTREAYNTASAHLL